MEFKVGDKFKSGGCTITIKDKTVYGDVYGDEDIQYTLAFEDRPYDKWVVSHKYVIEKKLFSIRPKYTLPQLIDMHNEGKRGTFISKNKSKITLGKDGIYDIADNLVKLSSERMNNDYEEVIEPEIIRCKWEDLPKYADKNIRPIAKIDEVDYNCSFRKVYEWKMTKKRMLGDWEVEL